MSQTIELKQLAKQKAAVERPENFTVSLPFFTAFSLLGQLVPEIVATCRGGCRLHGPASRTSRKYSKLTPEPQERMRLSPSEHETGAQPQTRALAKSNTSTEPGFRLDPVHYNRKPKLTWNSAMRPSVTRIARTLSRAEQVCGYEEAVACAAPARTRIPPRGGVGAACWRSGAATARAARRGSRFRCATKKRVGSFIRPDGRRCRTSGVMRRQP